MRFPALIVLSLSLTGCSSVLETWKGRPFGSHNYRADKLYIMSADRRIMLTGMVGSDKVACPELSPEIAVSRGASSDFSLSQKEFETASLKDAITALQMKGHELDGSSQKYAMIQSTLCNNYLNKTLSKDEYKAALLSLIAAGTQAMINQAQPPKEEKKNEDKAAGGEKTGDKGGAAAPTKVVVPVVGPTANNGVKK